MKIQIEVPDDAFTNARIKQLEAQNKTYFDLLATLTDEIEDLRAMESVQAFLQTLSK